MSKEPVYEEVDRELVPARGHGEGVFYRIFFGTVTWRSDPVPAFVILMQYGSEREWSRATREIAFGMPAHIADGDLNYVELAIESLKARVR